MNKIHKDTKDKVIVVIENDSVVRIKKNRKAERFFNRNYGRSEKVVKALKKAGLKKGKNKLSLDEFKAVLENVPTRIDRSLKNVREVSGEGTCEVYNASNRARRVYRKVWKENNSLPEDMQLVVEKVVDSNTIKFVFVEKETSNSEEAFDEFF